MIRGRNESEAARRYVFEDPAMVDALRNQLASWPGTPFFPRKAEHGVGADCIQFGFAPLQGLGVVGPIAWPRYSVKGGGPELLELIESRIAAETCLRCVWRRGAPAIAAMPGDIVLAGSPLHVAIEGPDGELWQSLYPGGVQHGVMSEDLRARVVSVYRAERILP